MVTLRRARRDRWTTWTDQFLRPNKASHSNEVSLRRAERNSFRNTTGGGQLDGNLRTFWLSTWNVPSKVTRSVASTVICAQRCSITIISTNIDSVTEPFVIAKKTDSFTSTQHASTLLWSSYCKTRAGMMRRRCLSGWLIVFAFLSKSCPKLYWLW